MPGLLRLLATPGMAVVGQGVGQVGELQWAAPCPSCHPCPQSALPLWSLYSHRSRSGWARRLKRGTHTLRAPKYQIVSVLDGIADAQERERLKTIRSDRFDAASASALRG
jgi:hypothetical protein